jgi:predicted flap endonuclease-1-like 5' DNA nuclease
LIPTEFYKVDAMWFLLLQIFLLMVLAAAFGGALAWWWMKRRYEDVTDSHEQLVARVSDMAPLATRADLERGVAVLSSSVEAIQPTDIAPLEDRLARFELAMDDRLTPIERRLTSFSLDPVVTHVADLSSRISSMRGPDLRPIEERLAIIEQRIRSLPEVDLGPVHSGIATLDLAIARLEKPSRSIEPVNARVANLETKLDEVADLIDAARRSDANALSERLAAVERAIAGIAIPAAPDLRPLQARLAVIENALAALDRPPVDLEPMEKRLGALQEALQSIPEPDFTAVIGAVSAIDSRLDLEATQNRLTAIEYGLAAVHHMLRTRPEAPAARNEPAALRSVAAGAAAPKFPPMPPPPKPPREIDPINAFRRGGDSANLLREPAFGPPDDLQQIEGVGPMLAALLHEIGVYYYWQVAEWTPEDIAVVESRLMNFRGRIMRDDWIGCARLLAASSTAAQRPMPYGQDAAE